jgi:hypothetical protein
MSNHHFSPAITLMLQDIAAGLRRSKQLASSRNVSAETRNWWSGYTKALQDQQSGVLRRLAIKDAALEQLQAGIQTARTGLSESLEVSAIVNHGQGLATQSDQVAAHELPHLQIDAVQQLEDNAVALIDANNEHAVAPADVRDSSIQSHSASLSEPIVQEGGAQ